MLDLVFLDFSHSTHFLLLGIGFPWRRNWLDSNLPLLLRAKQKGFHLKIIVVMTTKASQWDSFHVELAMECHAGKRILTSCRVTCWLNHAAAGNSRGHFNIVEGCNAFHVVTLHVTSTSAPKALTLSLNSTSLAHSTSEVHLRAWTQNRHQMTRFGIVMPRDWSG